MSYKSYEGSVTVFSTLVMILIISLVGVLIESERREGARVIVSDAGRLAICSMFGAYETELLDQYGILNFDGAFGTDEINKKIIEEKLKEDMEYNIDTDKGLYYMKGHDYYGVQIDEVSVENIITSAAANGLVLREQIIDYAKIDYSLELIQQLLQLKDAQEKNTIISEAADKISDCYESLSNISYNYFKLIEAVDGVKCNSGGIDFSDLKAISWSVKSVYFMDIFNISKDIISINDDRIFNFVKDNVLDVRAVIDVIKSDAQAVAKCDSSKEDELVFYCQVIQNMASGVRDNTIKAKKAIDSMKSEMEILDLGINDAVEFVLKLIELIDEETYKEFSKDISKIKEYKSVMEQKLKCIEGMEEILNSNLDIITEVEKLCQNTNVFEKNKLSIYAERIYGDYSDILELIKNYTCSGMYLDYSDIDCRKEDKSILGCLYEYALSGVYALVLPKNTQMSDRKITSKDLADMYEIKGERNLFITDKSIDFLKELIFDVYLCDKFPCFTDKQTNGEIDYALEYIVFGKEKDKDNLKSAINSISGVRFVCNLGFLMVNSEMKSQAYDIALGALGFTGNIGLVKALQYVILTAWAVGETVVDLRLLLDGKKVPAIKKKEEFRLSLENLLKGNLDIKKEENNNGLTYKQYLIFKMLFIDEEKKAYRTMSLIEMYMIGCGVDNFRLKNYVFGMDIKIIYHLKNSDKRYTEYISYSY